MHRHHGSSELDKQIGAWVLAGLFLTALLGASIFSGTAAASDGAAGLTTAIEALAPGQAQA